MRFRVLSYIACRFELQRLVEGDWLVIGTLAAQICSVAFAALLLAGCANAHGQEMSTEYAADAVEITAVATLRADQVIQVQVRFESGSGAVGDAFWVCPPDHEKYSEVLDYLGAPGEGEIVTRNEWPYALLPLN